VREFHKEVVAWRRHIHQHPELLYDVVATADFVQKKLRSFGCDSVETGVGRTGVVAVIKGKGDGDAIGLRADMDALPIHETSGRPWSSKTPGKAHSCGHDGHTAMLLGAARYLAETRNFFGSVVLIFQPAEEGGAGALAMLDDGLLERFGIVEVFGMHNDPRLPVGQFGIRKSGIMAAGDTFEITVNGRGGHAAQPHKSIDPVLTAAHVIIAVQSIVSRETDPLNSLVITVASIHGGTATNIIPDSVVLRGTVRTLLPEVGEYAQKRLREVVRATASAYGAEAEVTYRTGYPVTFNHDVQTDRSVEAAAIVVGEAAVDTNIPPLMGAEDFSFMLERRPGSFIFIGNGRGAELHNSAYDFNDEAIPYGISYWAVLAESILRRRISM